MTPQQRAEQSGRSGAGRLRTEFDEFSGDYEGGLRNPVRGLLGKGLADFIEVKVFWLLRDLGGAGGSVGIGEATRLLDYGCGTGVFLQLLSEGGFPGALCGCDVSTGMLAQARSAWPGGSAMDLRPIRDGRAPFEDRSFDVILGSGVFHHIPPGERPGAFADIARMLRPGGRAYIFEHNPLNPVTQWVVRRTPVDQDAVLLPARETAQRLAAAGLRDLRKAYLMFFPPRWRWARAGERWLRWLPLGGQYVAVGNRPRSG